MKNKAPCCAVHCCVVALNVAYWPTHPGERIDNRPSQPPRVFKTLVPKLSVPFLTVRSEWMHSIGDTWWSMQFVILFVKEIRLSVNASGFVFYQ